LKHGAELRKLKQEGKAYTSKLSYLRWKSTWRFKNMAQAIGEPTAGEDQPTEIKPSQHPPAIAHSSQQRDEDS